METIVPLLASVEKTASNEEIEAKVASLENDDFNPKMFKYSLPGD
jgi:hypothetical protein